MAPICTLNSLSATNPCLGAGFVPFSGRGFTLSSSQLFGGFHESKRKQEFCADPFPTNHSQKDLCMYLRDLSEAQHELSYHGEKIRNLELKFSSLVSNINLNLLKYKETQETGRVNRLLRSASYHRDSSYPNWILNPSSHHNHTLIRSTPQDFSADATHFNDLANCPEHNSSSAPQLKLSGEHDSANISPQVQGCSNHSGPILSCKTNLTTNVESDHSSSDSHPLDTSYDPCREKIFDSREPEQIISVCYTLCYISKMVMNAFHMP